MTAYKSYLLSTTFRAINLLFLSLLLIATPGCNSDNKAIEQEIVDDPETMDDVIKKQIKGARLFALDNKGKLDDSSRLGQVKLVNAFYKTNDDAGIWSSHAAWHPAVDTLLNFIDRCEIYGLFPHHYQPQKLAELKASLDSDSINRTNAALWTKADLLLTDRFMQLVKDLRIGRLGNDSTFLPRGDTTNSTSFFVATLHQFLRQQHLTALVASLEPKLEGYVQLKNALPRFLDSMDRKEYTYVPFPYKPSDEKDSLFFISKLRKRLQEADILGDKEGIEDSLHLNTVVKKFQRLRGVKADGKISASLVKLMNQTDVERLKRIAITLDRYKQLPAVMPSKYILVNLPAYQMKVWESDSVVLESKIICGTPTTKTPLLYSVISDMITYPTWTVPASIISKQYLPKLKNNPYYLSNIGLHLEDEKGERINPATINWSKYKKGIPYKVMQGSGDDNALGIIKFNFKNPYSVYLHDTNQRYLFKNAARALSHGCVRVQDWEQLAFYIARNDSASLNPGDTLRYNTDSIQNWLARKERRRIAVKTGIPLYIAYFSCEVKNDKIKFYDDIYGDDKMKRERFFK